MRIPWALGPLPHPPHPRLRRHISTTTLNTHTLSLKSPTTFNTHTNSNFIHRPRTLRQHGYIIDMPSCPPSPPPEAPSPPASPPSHAAADPIFSVPKLQRTLTPTEQLLGKQCRSNSSGDGPPQSPGKQDK